MSLNSFGNKLRSGPLGAIFFALVVICVGVLAFTGLGSYINNRHDTAATPQTPNDVLATVDGVPISVAQFQSVLSNIKLQDTQSGPTPSIAQSLQFRLQTFEQLEQPILMAQLAKADGLTVTADEIAAQRNKDLGPLRQELGLPANASESDISTALAGYGRTIDDVVNTDQIKMTLLGQKYQDHLSEVNQATDQTVQNYYREVETRHILISNKSRPDAQALALANDIITKLKAGGNFVALAKEYSDDPGTKNKGGEDGFISEATSYIPEFKNAALALQPPQITQTPVATPEYGYFIIQAEAVKSDLPKDFQKNHAQYVAQVTQTLMQQQEQSDLTAEKAKATVKINDPRLKGDLAIQSQAPGAMQTALTDYDAALGNADTNDKAEIYAIEGEIYQHIGQNDKAADSFKLALSNIEDSTLRLELGDLYRQKGDISDALTQYATASQNSYDNPQIHVQLMQDYRTLKQPQLAAKESDWLKQYEARQKQANAQPQPISTSQP